jgi:hypothetical protein
MLLRHCAAADGATQVPQLFAQVIDLPNRDNSK